MVHNGTGHKLLLDFLWAHPNSLDWPIKSSRPTKVCNVQYIYIYMYLFVYIYIEVCVLLEADHSLFCSL